MDYYVSIEPMTIHDSIVNPFQTGSKLLGMLW